MQIVIELSDRDYEMIKNGYGMNIDTMYTAIQNGTPLPKGHGRLIDADSIDQIIKPLEASDFEWGMTAETAKRLMHEAFNRCPTIIEADRSEDDGNDQ